MDGRQQFRLKWNNYHVNIANSFDSLRFDEDFVDVTLACDGFQVKAHRMVLSACSPYLRELLKSNPHQHPIVVLCDVDRGNMQLLLDYMYHGEVNVAQAQLANFLRVAEILKVKGLAEDRPPAADDTAPVPSADVTDADNDGPTSQCPADAAAPPEKRPRSIPSDRDSIKCEEADPEPGEVLPDAVMMSSPPQEPAAVEPSCEPGTSIDPGCDTGQDPPLAPPDPVGRPSAPRRASCPICGRWFQKGSHLREHVASIHYPVPSRCDLCNKVLRSRASLRTHLIKYHRRAEPRASPAGKLKGIGTAVTPKDRLV